MGDCASPIGVLADVAPLSVGLGLSVGPGRSAPCRHERRESGRRSFGYRLLLTPIDESTGEPEAEAEPVYVVGRDIGPRGIGLEHAEPLPYRRVRLLAADPRLDELGLGVLELDVTLRWCRFVGASRYESGGRVTRSTAPLAIAS
jgi:hypothetical protein